MAKGYWVKGKPPKKKSFTLSTFAKEAINDGFSKIIEDFKNQYISKEPNKMTNYLADVYPAWYHCNFYLVQKHKNENPDYIAHEFDEKFLRIEFIDTNKCHLAFKRYTGQWVEVAESITLDECKEMIVDMPYFHPIG